jgi:hypothetical protein
MRRSPVAVLLSLIARWYDCACGWKVTLSNCVPYPMAEPDRMLCPNCAAEVP